MIDTPVAAEWFNTLSTYTNWLSVALHGFVTDHDPGDRY